MIAAIRRFCTTFSLSILMGIALLPYRQGGSNQPAQDAVIVWEHGNLDLLDHLDAADRAQTDQLENELKTCRSSATKDAARLAPHWSASQKERIKRLKALGYIK